MHTSILLDGNWLPALDGSPRARWLFDWHYSRIHYKDGRTPKLFVGPGQKVVLLTQACDALFVWRSFTSADGQQGINCAIFRSEPLLQSSDLIVEVEQLAWKRWPHQRLFTHVNPKCVRYHQAPPAALEKLPASIIERGDDYERG